MAKKVKLSAKIALDIIMFVALVFLYKAKVLTLTYHEVMGLGIALFFLVHCLFNRTWIAETGKKLFSKSTPARTKFSYWITIFLVIDFLLIIVSGIFISKIIFKDAISSLNLGDTSVFRNIHLFCSALSLILIGIHVGIYWPMVKGFFAKHINLPKRAGTTLAYVLLAVIVATGVYSLPTSSFTTWLASPFVQQSGHGGSGHGHGDRTENTVSSSSDSASETAAASSHTPKDGTSESTSASAASTSDTAESTTGTEKHSHGASQSDAASTAASENADSASESTSGSAAVAAESSSSATEAASDSATSASTEQKAEKAATKSSASTAESTSSSASEKSSHSGASSSSKSTSGDTSSAKSSGNHGNTITASNIATTFYQYTSIVGLFAAITYYIDRTLRKRAKSKRDAAKTQAE